MITVLALPNDSNRGFNARIFFSRALVLAYQYRFEDIINFQVILTLPSFINCRTKILEASVFPAPLSPDTTQHWQQKTDQCIRNLEWC